MLIGYLKGTIAEVLDATAIIDVSGVGYRVEIPEGNLLEGENTELFIHTALRENDLSLWGFLSRDDLKMFSLLLGVNGVGLRTAQTLVYSLGTGKIVSAVLSGEASELKVPGIGKKTSEKIIIDLKDKLKQKGFSDDTDAGGKVMSEKSRQIVEDAIQAIERLGYKRAEILPVIDKMKPGEYEDSESLLKAILMQI